MQRAMGNGQWQNVLDKIIKYYVLGACTYPLSMYLPEVREIVAYNTVSYVLISVKVKGQSKAIPYGQRARARARGKDSQLEETSPAR